MRRRNASRHSRWSAAFEPDPGACISTGSLRRAMDVEWMSRMRGWLRPSSSSLFLSHFRRFKIFELSTYGLWINGAVQSSRFGIPWSETTLRPNYLRTRSTSIGDVTVCHASAGQVRVMMRRGWNTSNEMSLLEERISLPSSPRFLCPPILPVEWCHGAHRFSFRDDGCRHSNVWITWSRRAVSFGIGVADLAYSQQG